MALLFLLVIVGIAGWLVFSLARQARHEHQVSGLHGRDVQTRVRHEAVTKAAREAAEDAARAERLGELGMEAASTARRGVTVAGWEEVADWTRVSFSDGSNWLLRTDLPARRLMDANRSALVVRSVAAGADGKLSVVFWSQLSGDAPVEVADAVCVAAPGAA